MDVMPEHARHPAPAERTSGTIAAWAVLIGMGGTTVTYNIWHAVHAGRLNAVLAVLYGIAPVFAAMGLSHIVATHKGGRFMQAVTFGVMLGAMVLSIGAVAAVVGATAGPVPLKWLFGLVLDTAALVALRVILAEREQDAARQEAAGAAALAREEATGTAALEAARAEAREATARAAGIEAELASKTAALEAELARLGTALEVERARVEALKPPRGSGRRKPASSASAKRTSSAPNPARELPASSDLNSQVPPDVDVQAEALRILAEDRDISGSELGRRLGVSESYGCRLKRELTAAAPGREG